jgi:hypothetical protein
MINEQVTGWLEPDENYKKEFESCANGSNEPPLDWWCAKKYCEHMLELTKLGKKKFDILKGDGFFTWKLDECGVTHIDTLYEGKKYVVFLDMHS